MASARAALTGALLFAAGVAAQALEPPLPLPVIERPLAGKALADVLRGGGYVLVMRHAKQAGPQQLEGCDKRNLAPEGEAQARKVGAALRELRVPIGAVLASPICRARQTAELMDVGPVEITEDLKPGTGSTLELHAARKRLLARAPASGTHSLLVSHGHGSMRPEERIEYEFAEIIVFRPEGGENAVPIARIRLEDWDVLLALR